MFKQIKVADTRLAHSQNGVKQIIEKTMEGRKSYMQRRMKNAIAIMDTNHIRGKNASPWRCLSAAGGSLRRSSHFPINRSLHSTQAILLFFPAAVAGTLNAVAAGGSFVSFPVLLFTGVPAVEANATNTLALWPGLAASTVVYLKRLGAPFACWFPC
jgi:hypothetical protein